MSRCRQKNILHKQLGQHSVGAHPLFDTLRWQGLNPVNLAYSPSGWMAGSTNSQRFNRLGQYASSPGNRGCAGSDGCNYRQYSFCLLWGMARLSYRHHSNDWENVSALWQHIMRECGRPPRCLHAVLNFIVL